MNETVSQRKVVVALAGVMCRGARWGIHLPWALLHARIIVPLRAHNVDVEVWGFNNIPPSIDGCSVPADGGKSLFGDLDYYEAYEQQDIDDSPQIHRLLEIVGLAGHSYSTNIAESCSWREKFASCSRRDYEVVTCRQIPQHTLSLLTFFIMRRVNSPRLGPESRYALGNRKTASRDREKT